MAKRPVKKFPEDGHRVGVARARSGQGWALSHPRCARQCAEDLEEAEAMIAAGETDVAIDELRWLIEVCPELLQAHCLLGRLAVETLRDVPLGRGHFGFAYQLVKRVLQRAGNPTPLPALHPANKPFYEAGRGLAWCLAELDKRDLALEVIEHLLRCDPADPLGLGSWIDEIKTAGAPIIEIGGLVLPPTDSSSADDEKS